MAVVAKVLRQEEDPAAVFVGRLISKLIRKVPLGPVVEPLLHSVLHRLHRATMLSLEQVWVVKFLDLYLYFFKAVCVLFLYMFASIVVILQALVAVFAQLVLMDLPQTLALLERTTGTV